MRLGVNGWRIQGQRTGVYRYLINILKRWDRDAVDGRFEEITFYSPLPVLREEFGIPENIRVRVLTPNWRLLVWENLRLGPAVTDDILWGPSFSRPLFTRSRSVVTTFEAIQHLHPAMFPKSVKYFYSPLYRWSARHSALVITTSEASRQDIARSMGVPLQNVHVVPLASDEIFRFLPDQDRDQEIRRRFLGEDVPYFLFVGKRTGRRNIPLLFEAFAKFKRDTSLSHRLLLVGPMSQQVQLAKLLEELDITAEVKQSGFVSDEDLNFIYNAAEAYISPSTYEPISLPVMESQATGIPVIAVDTPGMRETTGGAALLLPEFEVPSVAEAMAKVAADRNFRTDLARRGYENSKRFSWDRTAGETLELLHRAATQRT